MGGDTYQENHPDGVVGEDDQANGQETESHHLVCPCGLEKREGSADEVPTFRAPKEGASLAVYALNFPFIHSYTAGTNA